MVFTSERLVFSHFKHTLMCQCLSVQSICVEAVMLAECSKYMSHGCHRVQNILYCYTSPVHVGYKVWETSYLVDVLQFDSAVFC